MSTKNEPDPEYRAHSIKPVSPGSEEYRTKCDFCQAEIVLVDRQRLAVEYQSKCSHIYTIGVIQCVPPKLFITFKIER